MKNANQKGGELTPDVLTDEVIESASNILKGRGGNTKGLQQFYAPEPLARFAKAISDSTMVLDLTAGDGSLIQHWPEAGRFGTEIDGSQQTAARRDGRPYLIIEGDVQHSAPVLAEMNLRFPALALNPPFGLKWKDPEYKQGAEVNSAELTMFYASKLLSYNGQGLLVTGGDGGWEQVIKPFFDAQEYTSNSHKLIAYGVIVVDDLWAETRVSNQLVLFGWHRKRYSDSGAHAEPVVWEKSLSQINDDLFVRSVNQIRRQSVTTDYYGSRSSEQRTMEKKFRAAAAEYRLRTGAKKRSRPKDYDIYAEGDKVRINPRPFVRYKMARSELLDNIITLDKQPLNYFGLNSKRWREIEGLEDAGTLAIVPSLRPRVQKIVDEAQRDLTPLYALKPQQRLAWLEDLEQIECVKTSEDERFKAGEKYRLETKPFKQVEIENNRPAKDKDGRPTMAQFRKERWILKFIIDGQTFYENKGDIEFLIEHFNVPDPGTIEDRYPEQVKRWADRLALLESSKTWKFKPFQKTDLSRLIVKGSGLLAWEQGLGKTLAGLSWAKALIDEGKMREQVLIICPQDLIPQWQREAERFYGVKLEWLRNGRNFREAAAHLAGGGKGWYITHYEAISRSGRQQSFVPLELRVGYKQYSIKASQEWNPKTNEWDEVPAKTYTVPVTRGERCPRCDSTPRQGSDPGGTCKGHLPHSRIIGVEGKDEYHDFSSECGWNPYEVRTKSHHDIIKKVFQQGGLILDELTKIKADNSLISLTVRGISARYTLGMTGTPIKNYAPDAYWGLWKCLGNNTPRFPFNYTDGQSEFETRFSTIEWRMDGRGRKQGKKRLPEVSNISLLWRLLAPNIIRRRKEETGENLVPRTFYPTLVPVGMAQRKVTEQWLKAFAEYFKEKYPDHPLVEKGLVDWMAPMLGLQPKLEYSATMPLADPDAGWWHERGKSPPESNWTPKNVRVMELAMHHASKGEKVLIGSALKAPGRWFTDELNKRLSTPEAIESGKGLKVINILAKTEDEDELKTMNPAQRAKVTREFQMGEAQVLVSSHALNLGHNLDKGSVVILTGLPWDYATFDQFIARVHRLTSEKAVRVYVVLAKGTIDERKWKLLVDKSSAANLALDGRLIEENEEHINEGDILQQMMKAGIPITGDEVNEAELERAWEKIKSPADLPELVLTGTAVADLTELKEDEEDVPEAATTEPEGSAVVEPAPDDRPEPSEDTPVEVEPDTESPVAGAEMAEVEGYLVVHGSCPLDSVHAALYHGNTMLAGCTHSFGLTGKMVTLIECKATGGFGPRAQEARLQSFGDLGVGRFEEWELASAQVQRQTWFDHYANLEALAAEAQTTIEEAVPEPVNITEAENGDGGPIGDGLAEAPPYDLTEDRYDDPDVVTLADDEPELVTAGVSDDYLAGF